MSPCLVQDDGGDLGSAGRPWGPTVYSPVAQCWEILSHSCASAEACCSALLCRNYANVFYVSILPLRNREKQQETSTRSCGARSIPFFFPFLMVSPFDFKGEVWKYRESRTVQSLNIRGMQPSPTLFPSSLFYLALWCP